MRNFKLGTIIMAGLFCAGLLFTPSLTSSVDAADQAAAKVLYEKKCAKCHGLTGKGDGKKAKTLKKKPRDYTDKAKMSEFTDEELIEHTKKGKKPMPAYGKGKRKLTDEQIADLITYIRTFAK
jgi:mono/diheme cytochrome c family protein